MTFRERFLKEHPDGVGSSYIGGCLGCPYIYGYEKKSNGVCASMKNCTDCWNREIPETESHNPTIKKVVFNNPATIILWEDGTKTVVKVRDEDFDPEKGMAMAIIKKIYGDNYYGEIKKWTELYYKRCVESRDCSACLFSDHPHLDLTCVACEFNDFFTGSRHINFKPKKGYTCQ